jgi:ABC-type Fe3+/spermidine/putrescine transport system ATPase subunit
VGISNLLNAEQAVAITGQQRPFSVRPEKIQLGEPGTPIPANSCSALGQIREVTYLGMHTRYAVALDVGGELLVVEQNRTVNAQDIFAAQGRRVQLLWPTAANNPL